MEEVICPDIDQCKDSKCIHRIPHKETEYCTFSQFRDAYFCRVKCVNYFITQIKKVIKGE